MPTHLPIFVYGTLQRGEERATQWPHPPTCIEWATVRAELRDLGAYPAILPGDDLVLGELWHVSSEHLDRTLHVLDEIEGYTDSDDDLYTREIIDCTTLAGDQRSCHAYFFRNAERIATASIVLPDQDGFCHWHRGSGWFSP